MTERPLPHASISNTVGGDQVNITGDGNIGIVKRGDSRQSLTVRERGEAARELAILIEGLERAGLLTPAGEIVDRAAARAAVEDGREGVPHLVKAVLSGLGAAVAKGLEHAAGPAVVTLIESCLR